MSDDPKKDKEKAPAIVAPPKFDAALLLKQTAGIVQETQAADAKDDSDRWQYYIRCHRGCIGAFLKGGHPQGRVLSNADWATDYHDFGESWQLDIYCQVCSFKAMRSESRDLYVIELPVRYLPSKSRKEVSFTVPPEYLFRFPKDPEELRARRLLGETGHHRATLMNNPIMNDGIPTDLRAELAREGANAS